MKIDVIFAELILRVVQDYDGVVTSESPKVLVLDEGQEVGLVNNNLVDKESSEFCHFDVVELDGILVSREKLSQFLLKRCRGVYSFSFEVNFEVKGVKSAVRQLEFIRIIYKIKMTTIQICKCHFTKLYNILYKRFRAGLNGTKTLFLSIKQ